MLTLTANSWAENHHISWTDVYTGRLSINGSERFKKNNVTHYPRSITLKYDVQGKITSDTVYSSGNSTIQKTIKAYDKWNFGTKTQVYYKSSSTTDSSVDVMSINTQLNK